MKRLPAVLIVTGLGLAGALVYGTSSSPPPETDHVFVGVAAGVYPVGSAGHALNPARQVTLKAFEIADAETTNAQFRRFVEASGYVTDAEQRGSGMTFRVGLGDWEWRSTPGATWLKPFGPGSEPCHPDHPVTQISQADAAAYCEWAGLRLPSLDEWEVAARAGADTTFPWGEVLAPAGQHRANVWQGDHTQATPQDGHLYTAPVRSHPPNAWGLYDVIGNVFEYCADPGLDRDLRPNPQLSSGRGGSWWCSDDTCAFYNLVDVGAMNRHGSLSNQGFRVVRSVE